MQSQIVDEQSANNVLKTVVVGSKVRIVFRSDAGDKLFSQLSCLRHKLSFDMEWLVLVNNCVATTGRWEGIPRVQDFTITRMSPADREVFAHVLAEIAESIEAL